MGADDQQDVLTAMRLLLKNNTYERHHRDFARRPAREAVRSEIFDVAIIDLNYARIRPVRTMRAS